MTSNARGGGRILGSLHSADGTGVVRKEATGVKQPHAAR